MNVLAVSDYLNNVGGAEISTREILVALAKAPDIDRVTVVGIDAPSKARLNYPGVDVISISPPEITQELPDYVADLVLARLLGRAVDKRTSDADLIHSHHRRSTLALAHVETTVPTVSTIRDFWPICPISTYSVDGEQCSGCEDRLNDCVKCQGFSGITTELVKPYFLLKRRSNARGLEPVDCAVFIANHIRDTIGSSIQLPPRTEVIYNPVTLPEGINDAHRETDEWHVVTASSLTKNKGIDVAIQSIALLEERGFDVILEVFGDGPHRPELERFADEMNVSESIRFHGRRPLEDVYGGIRSADVTVFPSIWHEPFGRVTVESMRLGTPVVGSDIGGIGEIIESGRTGLLFQPNDPDSLTERLITLFDDELFRARLAERASLFAEQFDPKQVADEHVRVYRSLV